MRTKPTQTVRGTKRSRSRSVNPRLRDFCRSIDLDPKDVLTTFPNVAALIDALGAS
jgi:hypothetical protein